LPANLSPEYKKAEQAFRRAREPRERLELLKEMLRTIPKHKGTEHLQADLKSRIKELTEEVSGPRKGAARTAAAHSVRPEGAAQICLVGPPNSGKSSLHARLTGAKSEVGPFPYTTATLVPGMLPWEDISFQLVDLPPVSREHAAPWIYGVLHGADAAWLVIDLADAACAGHVLAVRDELAGRKITLTDRWPGLAGPPEAGEEVPDPFGATLPTLLLGNKCDLDPVPGEIEALEELAGVRFPALAVSAQTGEGLERLAPFLAEALGIVRVYTKVPGKPADRDRPFVVRRGATVLDVAQRVHQDLAHTLRFARLWGSGAFDAQQVGPEHPVADRDVVELHVR
jgi:ribosome-interacting GTPase 1